MKLMQTNFKVHFFTSAFNHHFHTETFSSCITILQILFSQLVKNSKTNFTFGPLLIDEGGALSLQPSTYEMKEVLQSSNPLLIDVGGFSVMSYHQPFDSVIFPFTVLSCFDCDRKSLMKKSLLCSCIPGSKSYL